MPVQVIGWVFLFIFSDFSLSYKNGCGKEHVIQVIPN